MALNAEAPQVRPEVEMRQLQGNACAGCRQPLPPTPSFSRLLTLTSSKVISPHTYTCCSLTRPLDNAQRRYTPYVMQGVQGVESSVMTVVCCDRHHCLILAECCFNTLQYHEAAFINQYCMRRVGLCCASTPAASSVDHAIQGALHASHGGRFTFGTLHPAQACSSHQPQNFSPKLWCA